MMRLFIAINLDEPIRSKLGILQNALRPRCPDVRWVRIDQLHLTVKFLGDVSDRDVEKVGTSLKSAVAGLDPFDLLIGGTGCFPPRREVRIVWAGGKEETGGLDRCVAAVEGAMNPLGFAPERRGFSPHITIGRVKEDRSGGSLRDTVASAKLDTLVQPVSRITLMSSVLSPKGPTYAVVCQCPFDREPST